MVHINWTMLYWLSLSQTVCVCGRKQVKRILSLIVDLTDPSSAPHEVAMIVPHTVVPVQPLLSRDPLVVDGNVVDQREYAMFEDLRRRYHWVPPTFCYQNTADLLAAI